MTQPFHESIINEMSHVTKDAKHCTARAVCIARIIATTTIPARAPDVLRAFTLMMNRLGNVQSRRFNNDDRLHLKRTYAALQAAVRAEHTRQSQTAADMPAAAQAHPDSI